MKGKNIMKTSTKWPAPLDIGSHLNAGPQARREAGAQRMLYAVAYMLLLGWLPYLYPVASAGLPAS
jgi:hypothetical protein